MKRSLFGMAAILLWATGAPAQNGTEEAAAVETKPCPNTLAYTVFVNDRTGSRQKGSAERLSDAHRNAQEQGWDFKDLEIYIEDGDLQGFFVTYTKPHPCNS